MESNCTGCGGCKLRFLLDGFLTSEQLRAWLKRGRGRDQHPRRAPESSRRPTIATEDFILLGEEALSHQGAGALAALEAVAVPLAIFKRDELPSFKS